MEIGTHISLPVVEGSQPSSVRFAVRELADRHQFSEADSYRAGLVATELATNLVKHAQAGEMLIRGTSSGGPEIEMLAIDKGPGITNVNRALVDGHSTAGTNGTGLGGIRRMADGFEIYSSMPQGTVVLARVRPRGASGRVEGPFTLEGVSVAKAGEHECGDAWMQSDRPQGALAVVADGLGHGHFAAEAVRAVIETVRARTYPSCTATLAAVHESIRHTRGAAAAVAEVALEERIVRFAGVGNIGAAVVHDQVVRQAVSHNGTLGHQKPAFREYQYPWPVNGLLVMYSDGLVSRWSFDRYPGLLVRRPAIIAAVLYRDFKRGRDDVTVVVGREAA